MADARFPGQRAATGCSNILTPNPVLGTAMLNLTVPIYQGGAEYSAIRLNKETVGQATAQRRPGPRPDAGQRRASVGAAVRRRRRRSKRRIRQNDASERALNGVRNEAQAGQRTTLDVLNAEQALVNARVNLIVAQHDRVVASYSLRVRRRPAFGAGTCGCRSRSTTRSCIISRCATPGSACARPTAVENTGFISFAGYR